jgi:hypothetical protein
MVSVAIYCRMSTDCLGIATLSAIGRDASRGRGRSSVYGSSRFRLQAKKTAHVRIRVSSRLIKMLRKNRGGVPATLAVAVGGRTVTQTIALRIF